MNNCSHFDIKVRAKQTGFINENKMVKYKLCKSCNPQFNLLSPNVALKQHSNFLALTPTVAYEQWNPFVYLKSVKNFPSVEYSRLKFSCVEKKLQVLQDFFSKVYNLVADVFSSMFVVFIINLYDLWKMCFLWRNYSRIWIYQLIKMFFLSFWSVAKFQFVALQQQWAYGA